MALTTQLRQQGYPLTPKDIFTHKTIEEIAQWLDAQLSLLGIMNQPGVLCLQLLLLPSQMC
ncbi:hypothetical protein P4S72_09905 [Vibrio sp. PP-XX7]